MTNLMPQPLICNSINLHVRYFLEDLVRDVLGYDRRRQWAEKDAVRIIDDIDAIISSSIITGLEKQRHKFRDHLLCRERGESGLDSAKCGKSGRWCWKGVPISQSVPLKPWGHSHTPCGLQVPPLRQPCLQRELVTEKNNIHQLMVS